MFALGKMLSFLEAPLVWLVVLCLWLAWKSRVRSIYFLAGFIWLLGNAPLANWALGLWQYPLDPWPVRGEYKAAVVLGGFTSMNTVIQDRVLIARGADRFTHALRLYKEGRVERLVLTGGSSNVVLDATMTEAEAMAQLFSTAGVPDSALVLESHARSTAENAAFSKLKLDSLGLGADTVLLITSAWHMRRAVACFQHQGIVVKPFPVDPRAINPASPWLWLDPIPKVEAVLMWETLVHEVLGLWAYKLAGKA